MVEDTAVEDTAHLKAFHMPFDSMEPTIATGAKVIGDVGYYGSNRPQRWEVVVFSLPGNDGEFIKRIVGLPGEKITLGPAGLLVDGSPVDPPVALKKCFSKFRQRKEYKHGAEEIRVPDDCVFVLGDNQEIHVADSRQHGAVPIRNLGAKVFAAVQLTLM